VSGVHDLALFVVAGLLLNFTPGADTLYIVSRSAAQGARGGAMAALGIGVGCLVHVSAAAFGLSALLAASAAAFTAVKLAGAAYLVYLGLALWRSPRADSSGDTPPVPHATLRKVFVQGIVTNVLNPKVALFFLSFLPQFIDAGAPDKLAAFLLLGLVFDVNATLWNLFVAWFSARVARRSWRGNAFATWLRRGAGAVFVLLGIRLAFSDRP
jgi:threonine/homoserine/homoserine lactone efflux protein